MQQTITVEVRIEEDETDTLVHAVLSLRGDCFEATGRMPLVGEELATARALSSLALQVMESAQVKIEDFLQAV
jgi:hypothetical protein